MKSRILILIGAHLCTAPRPQKEARALAEAGFEVTIAGNWFDPVLADRDRLLLQNAPFRFLPVSDFRKVNLKGRLLEKIVRTRVGAARFLFQRRLLCLPDLLGFWPARALRLAERLRPDLTIVHSEGGLWVAEKLLAGGHRVAVDFEDWFSRDLTPSARAGRPIQMLERLEKLVARRACFSFATSNAMARSLAEAYDAPLPRVVYNVFSKESRRALDGRRTDGRNSALPSLHWFSQTIGPGRGLETLFAALPHLKNPVEVHLRGAISAHHRVWLKEASSGLSIHTHDTVPNGELLSRISEHDIGLALETTHITNRNLTVTNKLFQYMQAGLAIIATDTAGQREVLSRCPKVGGIVPDGNALALANAIDSLSGDAERLRSAKEASLQALEDEFSWENQKSVVIEAASTALGQNPKSAQAKKLKTAFAAH